eukprot:5653159-Pyramimonas_sp.AAC.1
MLLPRGVLATVVNRCGPWPCLRKKEPQDAPLCLRKTGSAFTPPSSGHALAPGRATQGVVQVPGGASYHMCSVYLHDAEGLSERNLELVCRVWACVSACCSSFVVGGDFNVSPGELTS